MTFEGTLDAIEAEIGGFGPTTVEAIRETFDSEEAFETAVRQAYEERDTDALEAVPGLGHDYSLALARWYAAREDWSGGEAEPHEFRVLSGDEVREMR